MRKRFITVSLAMWWFVPSAWADIPPPLRIDTHVYSSNTRQPVIGALVVFEKGRPRPPSYRRFLDKMFRKQAINPLLADTVFTDSLGTFTLWSGSYLVEVDYRDHETRMLYWPDDLTAPECCGIDTLWLKPTVR